jgi:transposase-like protein
MRAPVLAVGDGALGFWAALRDVFPHTRHQRDWVHKTSNILDSLPKSVHKRAKKAIHEITEADNKKEAAHAIEAFASEFGTKWPKAVAKITQEKELLLTFYEFPAEHWVHLRTTNPIESTFAPVGEGADRRNEGARVESGRSGNDLQTDGGGRREVAEDKRSSSGAAGQGRSAVCEWRVG